MIESTRGESTERQGDRHTEPETETETEKETETETETHQKIQTRKCWQANGDTVH